MSYLRCEKCKQDFIKPFGSSKCPECGTKSESTAWEKHNEIIESSLSDQAIKQAKVVTSFGEFLQVIGYLLIGLCVLGLIGSLLSKNWIGGLVSAVAIPLCFAFYNVLGSAFRAFGLYIQIKVKE